MDAIDGSKGTRNTARVNGGERKAGGARMTRVAAAIAVVAAASTAGALAFDLAVDNRATRIAEDLSAYSKQPIPSRNLTVTIQPLVPGEQAAAALARDSEITGTAQQLISSEGLEALGANLAELFPFSYEVAQPLTIPDEYFNAERQQYNINKVLTWLLKQRDEASFKTVGVLSADVYEPGFNYLFGLAKLGGPGCVVSARRMGGKVVFGTKSPAERWHLVVRHELGHTLGLSHAEEKASVMHFSNSLSELDASSPELTRRDWSMLREVLPVQWQRD